MQQQRVTGIFFVALGILVYCIAPSQSENATSAKFPQMIGLGLAILGLIHGLCLGKTSNNKAIKQLWQPLLLQYYAIVTLAIIGIQFIGFYPVMIIFLPLCAFLFGARNKLSLGIFSLVVTSVFYLVLDVLLGSNLP